MTLVILPSPRGWSGAAAFCSCSVSAAIFSCSASRMGWLFRSSSFIHCGTGSAAKVRGFHHLLDRLDPVIDHQTAPLSFQLFARFDQLLPLPMNGAGSFLFFAGHTHHRQRVAIALHEAIQLQTERLWHRVRRSLPACCAHPTSADKPRGKQFPGHQLPLQGKPKPARFIHGVHFTSAPAEFGSPNVKTLLSQNAAAAWDYSRLPASPPRKNPGAHQSQA